MPGIRAAVVALACDVANHHEYPALRRLSTDEPLTAEEVRLLGTATRPELEAVKRYFATAQEYHESKLADANRMVALLRQYGGTEDMRIGVVMATMSPADRAEMEAILDRAAPDGVFLIPPGGEP